MSIQVTFDGASLIRPVAATKVVTNQVTGPALSGSNVVGLVGSAKGGEGRVLKEFDNLPGLLAEYYDGDIADVAKTLFNATNDDRIAGLPQKILVYKTNDSTKSTLTLQNTTAALAGSFQLLNAAPYSMAPNDTFNYETNNSAGAQNVLFEGSAATVVGGGMTFAISAPGTLIMSMNGTALKTITFAGGEATIGVVTALINSSLSGGFVQDDGGTQLEFFSTQYGSGSEINIDASSTPQLLADLGLVAAITGPIGTQDAVDLNAVTAAEFEANVESFGGIVVDTSTAPPTLLDTVAGAGSFLTISASVPATLNTVLGATAGTYNGAAAGALVDVVRLDSANWGTHTNGIQVLAIDPSPTSDKRRLTITQVIDGATQTQASPELGEKTRFKIQYTGGGTCSMTITSTSIFLDSSVGPEDLTLLFADYPTLDTLLSTIDASAVFDVTEEDVRSTSFLPSDLDWVTVADIKTTPVDVYSSVYDVTNWIAREVTSIVATRLPTGATQFDSFVTPKTLLGAVEGSALTSHWTAALNSLTNKHVNTLVPLISEDLITGSNSVDFAAVVVGFGAHCKEMSEVSENQDERRCWIGVKGNKTTQLEVRNSLAPYGKYVTQNADRQRVPSGRANTLTFLPEWITSVMGAGMRAGLEIGEPLVHKSLNSKGTERDWNPDTPGEIQDLIREGLTLTAVDNDDGLIKFERVLTLTVEDNDVLREESIFAGVLVFVYDWRKSVERKFLGTKGSLTNAGAILGVSEQLFFLYGPRELGGIDFLINTTDENGIPVNFFRDLVVEIGKAPYPSDVAAMQVSVTVVSGINFILQTAAAVTGAVSVSA